MTNELITSDAINALGKFESEENKSLITASGGFLPRIMLMQSGSGPVAKKKAEQGTFVLIEGENVTHLGESFSVLVLAWRPKAMRFAPDVLSYHDPSSEEFQKIIAESDAPGQSSTGYGPEYLLWLPAPYSCYATYFFSNPTERREVANLETYMRGAATISANFIDPPKSRFSWWGPQITKCAQAFDIPTKEDDPEWFTTLDQTVSKFKNPPENEVETADDDAGDRER